MAAFSARRILTAYTLYEALMRAVADGDAGGADPEAMRIEGLEGNVTPAALLGGQEPSAPEEHLWFSERTRCRCLPWRMRPVHVVAMDPRCMCGVAGVSSGTLMYIGL